MGATPKLVSMALFGGSLLRAGTVLVVGPGAAFLPTELSRAVCPASCGSFSPLASLGDGSLSFRGGLVSGAGGLFYALASDASGASSLFSLTNSGANSLIGVPGALGFGFTGGMAFNGSTLLALAGNPAGDFSLYAVDPVTATSAALGITMGPGFNGLTYDPATAVYYGLASGANGESTLYRWTLAASALAGFTPVASLGPGVGGLAFDAARNGLWTIRNVNNAGSVLEFLTPAGAATPVAALGDGFSLVAVESVPEPASLAMVATALALAGGVRLRATPTEINESTNQGEK